MKVAILGGSGFLGTFLSDYLRLKKVKLITIGRDKKNNIKLTSYSKQELTKVFKKTNFDILINLCAITNVDLCEKKINLAKSVHIKLIKNISYIVKKLNPKGYIIQISTDQVYNTKGRNKEKDISLTNNYAKTKYLGEKYIYENSCILRTNFFGLSDTRTSLASWIIHSLRYKKKINVFDNIYFSPLYIKTLCHYIFLILKKKPKGVFNIGSSKCITKSEFAFYIAKKLNLDSNYLNKSSYKKENLYATRPNFMCMDSSKFKKQFHINLNSPFEEINKMIRDI